MPEKNEKNRYFGFVNRLPGGIEYTNWHVDLDYLDGDVDFKNFERMDLKPGDMVITDLAIMMALESNNDSPCQFCCLAAFNECTLHDDMKEMLCNICGCFKSEGHNVYLKEVNE